MPPPRWSGPFGGCCTADIHEKKVGINAVESRWGGRPESMQDGVERWGCPWGVAGGEPVWCNAWECCTTGQAGAGPACLARVSQHRGNLVPHLHLGAASGTSQHKNWTHLREGRQRSPTRQYRRRKEQSTGADSLCDNNALQQLTTLHCLCVACAHCRLSHLHCVAAGATQVHATRAGLQGPHT